VRADLDGDPPRLVSGSGKLKVSGAQIFQRPTKTACGKGAWNESSSAAAISFATNVYIPNGKMARNRAAVLQGKRRIRFLYEATKCAGHPAKKHQVF